MLIFLWWFILGDFDVIIAPQPTITPPLTGELLDMARVILNLTENIIQDSKQRVAHLSTIKQDNLLSAAFEVGYLTNAVQEKYRKMVDKYNTSIFMDARLYAIEHIMYLEEIEHHYFEIDHLNNMAHEIERKYKISGGINADYNVHLAVLKKKKQEEEAQKNLYVPLPYPQPDDMPGTRRPRPKPVTLSKSDLDRAQGFIKMYANRLEQRQKMTQYRGPFPLNYGWDVEGLPI